jgi:hypothetical protein
MITVIRLVTVYNATKTKRFRISLIIQILLSVSFHSNFIRSDISESGSFSIKSSKYTR